MLLHTLYISCGSHCFREDFLSSFRIMGAIYGHGGHLDLQSMTIYTNFQCLFSTRLHMKFEESWPHYKA